MLSHVQASHTRLHTHAPRPSPHTHASSRAATSHGLDSAKRRELLHGPGCQESPEQAGAPWLSLQFLALGLCVCHRG